MTRADLLVDDPLEDFTCRDVAVDGTVKRVYVTGSGPAVVVLAEMPGISPHLARFARWVADAGFTAYVPSLFGRDGAVGDAAEGAELFGRLCLSAEFRALGGGQTSPVTAWLRGLARLAHDEQGGPGVGAVGMCFTGNFALTMMLEPAVLAAVLSQPSLPFDAPGALEISPEDMAAVRRRLDTEDLTVLGLRFDGDLICRRERFDAYSQALGDRFVARTLPSEAAATEQIPPFFTSHVPFPHSVLTVHLVDEDGSLTRQARDEVLAFLGRQLHSGATRQPDGQGGDS
jgi:dienelactone hydrolase